MPIQSGSLSITRYRVLSELSPSFAHNLALRRYSYRPIDDSRGEAYSYEWVNPYNILEAPDWDQINDSGLALLTIRNDKKDIPAPLFKALLAKEFEDRKAKLNLDMLSRQQRLAIAEELRIKLLKSTSPNTCTYEALWDIPNRMIYIATPPGTNCDRIYDLIVATFDLQLERIKPCETDIDLGRRFLLWLTNQNIADAFYHPIDNIYMISVQGPIQFEGCQDVDKLTLHGDDAAHSDYTALALKQHARLEKCNLRIDSRDLLTTYTANIDAENLTLSGIKPPKAVSTDPRDKVKERYHHLQELHHLLDTLLEHFIQQENQPEPTTNTQNN